MLFFHPYTLWARMQSVLNILEFDKVSDTPILSSCQYFLGLKLKLFYTLYLLFYRNTSNKCEKKNFALVEEADYNIRYCILINNTKAPNIPPQFPD